MSKLHLILAFHNHQPVGNFEHVLERCYSDSYLPFLETLRRHTGLKVVLHYSGFLLSWMADRHPEAIAVIKSLVDSGRAEILSGGFYEPILSVLPEKDRLLQVREFSKYLKKLFGCSPAGIWLAERVWEPHMPAIISKTGARYLPIDDYHFKLTGLRESDLLGYFITEDGDCKVSVFPGSEKLRYFIPFRAVDETVAYFRKVYDSGKDPLLTMADDGEKFGIWPGTHKLCYTEGWLDNFFSAIEKNSDWIETTTFGSYHSEFQPVGRVYLPSASYREMGEWTLPARAGLEYGHIFEELKKTAGDEAAGLIRGGIWRSFMVKYPESNHIHKRMFMISGDVHGKAKKVGSGKSGKKPAGRERILHELWKGQCNDAYWHGIFGGLYLPHLRSALYRHLLTAESLAGAAGKYPVIRQGDFDVDGHEDIFIRTKDLAVGATVTGGSLTEISLYRQSVNILDMISRRPEAYHSKIPKASDPSGGPAETIHDRLMVKEPGLAEHLVYDNYRRSSLLDRFLPPEAGIEAVARSEYEEMGDFAGGKYSMSHSQKGKSAVLSFVREGSVRQDKVKIEKKVELNGGRRIGVAYLLSGNPPGMFAIEMNLSLMGSPDALIRVGGKDLPMRSTGMHDNIDRFIVRNEFLNLVVGYRFSEAIGLWHYPVETVSLSEEGIEKLYQGTCFLFLTGAGLRRRKKLSFTMNFGEDAR